MPVSNAPSEAAEAAFKLQAVRMQIDGARKFFDAALVLEDKKGVDNYRAQLHALLDMELDLNCIMYSIIRNAGSKTHK